MTQKERDLLFRDLSARLPYSPYVDWGDGTISKLGLISYEMLAKAYFQTEEHPLFKLCLRPTSSMTKEEKEDLLTTVCGKKYSKYFKVTKTGIFDNNLKYQDLNNFKFLNFVNRNISAYVNWMYLHHFNINLPRKLFTVAPEEMYKTK